MGKHIAEDMNRRTFLKGIGAVGAVAAGGAALAACSPSSGSSSSSSSQASSSASAATADEASSGKASFEIAPDPIDESEVKETIEAEVVIIGAGPSGMITAMSAIEEGLDVVVFAQSPDCVARGGSNAAVNSKYLREQGLEGVTPRFLLEQMTQNGFNIDVDKWHKWYTYSEESMDWLIDLTADYPGLEMCVEQSNEWDDTTYPLYGPSMSHCWNSADYPVIADGQPSLVLALKDLFQQAGGKIYFNTVAQQLVRGGEPNGTSGRVDAVIATNEDGDYVKFVGSKAIVLATGDFSGDREMMEKYAPQCCQWITNWNMETTPDVLAKVYGGLYTGQGHKMGLWVGAAWQKSWPNACQVATFGAPTPNPWNAPSTLMVNNDGERFCCEDMGCGHLPYVIHHIGAVNAIFDSDYPANNQPWHNWKNRHGEGDQTPEEVLASFESKVESGTMVKADTLEELADLLGCDADGLVATVDRYNELCDAKDDADFHKRAELLSPIRTAPFYGWHKDSIQANTVEGGLRTSIDMEVCDENDEPIPGLYNVGTMIGDCYAHTYNFLIEGHNHGMNCITFGYLTGKHIAEAE